MSVLDYLYSDFLIILMILIQNSSLADTDFLQYFLEKGYMYGDPCVTVLEV